jgi:hypothetical protein
VKKTIIFSLLALVIGITTGLVGGMAYFGHGMASFMVMVQESGIIEFEEAAVDAYRNQPTEVAIWALEHNINSINEIKDQRASADVEDPYILLTPDISLVFSHGRLSQLYKKMNNEDKHKYHLDKAMALFKETHLPGFDSEDKLIDFINKLDAASHKEVEK